MIISPTTKLYLITFKNYTNGLHTTVSNNKSSFIDSKEIVYIDTSEPIIVKEQDIMKYKDFDIDSIKYIGVLLEEDTTLPCSTVSIKINNTNDLTLFQEK